MFGAGKKSSLFYCSPVALALALTCLLVLLDRPAGTEAGHHHHHGASGTACIVKGSYCSCHYCKCEHGHIHCKGHGHGKKNYILFLVASSNTRREGLQLV